jgi:hypothetical protein
MLCGCTQPAEDVKEAHSERVERDDHDPLHLVLLDRCDESTPQYSPTPALGKRLTDGVRTLNAALMLLRPRRCGALLRLLAWSKEEPAYETEELVT